MSPPLSCLLLACALVVVAALPLHARPDTSQLESWSSIGDKSICRARVASNEMLPLGEVWCDDGVEGSVVEAGGELFVCRTVRLSVPFQDSDVDVAAGCVAVREGRRPSPWMASIRGQ